MPRWPERRRQVAMACCRVERALQGRGRLPASRRRSVVVTGPQRRPLVAGTAIHLITSSSTSRARA